jgi:DNA-binding NarL/FixJ family response regulator
MRVFVADDHDIVRRGVRGLVESQVGWELCGEAADGQTALDRATDLKPDVAVLDVSLPILNGLAVTRRLRQASPDTEILLFSMHDDDETVSGGLAAGARGYLLKSESDDLLVEAIASLGRHKPYFSASVSELLLDNALSDRPRPRSRLEGFTARELEVSQLIAEGNSNKMIARRLEISVKTVESHRAAAMRKANVRTAAEFVRFAIRHKLIEA